MILILMLFTHGQENCAQQEKYPGNGRTMIEVTFDKTSHLLSFGIRYVDLGST
jgi:hypothetical protein